jgi:hypothetical protein
MHRHKHGGAIPTVDLGQSLLASLVDGLRSSASVSEPMPRTLKASADERSGRSNRAVVRGFSRGECSADFLSLGRIPLLIGKPNRMILAQFHDRSLSSVSDDVVVVAARSQCAVAKGLNLQRGAHAAEQK